MEQKGQTEAGGRRPGAGARGPGSSPPPYAPRAQRGSRRNQPVGTRHKAALGPALGLGCCAPRAPRPVGPGSLGLAPRPAAPAPPAPAPTPVPAPARAWPGCGSAPARPPHHSFLLSGRRLPRLEGVTPMAICSTVRYFWYFILSPLRSRAGPRRRRRRRRHSPSRRRIDQLWAIRRRHSSRRSRDRRARRCGRAWLGLPLPPPPSPCVPGRSRRRRAWPAAPAAAAPSTPAGRGPAERSGGRVRVSREAGLAWLPLQSRWARPGHLRTRRPAQALRPRVAVFSAAGRSFFSTVSTQREYQQHTYSTDEKKKKKKSTACWFVTIN